VDTIQQAEAINNRVTRDDLPASQGLV
jgi:hypothetical protein